jgi:hypothetical protein
LNAAVTARSAADPRRRARGGGDRGPRLGRRAAGIVSLLVLLDAVIPMPGVTWPEADDRFARLLRARARARLRRRLRGLPPQRLEVVDDRAGWALVAARRSLGVRAIPIDSVTATVEDLKAQAFDREFRPDRASAEHWKRLWMAQARGAAMLPISVYRVGDRHVVRDGHHRVSVARERERERERERDRRRGRRAAGSVRQFSQPSRSQQ